jgi:hypothetical protein
MLLTDQLDFNNPDHVTVCCKHDRLTIYIRNNTTSVRLTYALQQEPTSAPAPVEVTYKGPNFCTPPHPPLPGYPTSTGHNQSLEW